MESTTAKNVAAEFIGVDFWNRPLFRLNGQYYCVVDFLLSYGEHEKARKIIAGVNDGSILLYSKGGKSEGEPSHPVFDIKVAW